MTIENFLLLVVGFAGGVMFVMSIALWAKSKIDKDEL